MIGLDRRHWACHLECLAQSYSRYKDDPVLVCDDDVIAGDECGAEPGRHKGLRVPVAHLLRPSGERAIAEQGKFELTQLFRVSVVAVSLKKKTLHRHCLEHDQPTQAGLMRTALVVEHQDSSPYSVFK